MAREDRQEAKQQRTLEYMARSSEQIEFGYSPFKQKQAEEEYATAKTEVTTEETAQSLSNLGVQVPSFMTATSPYISENPSNQSMTQTMQEAWLNMANPMEQALSYTFYNNFKYQLGLTPNDVKVSDMIDFTTYINETSSGAVYSFEDALEGYVTMQNQFGGTLQYYSPTKEVKLYNDYINMQTTYGGVSEEVAAQQYVDARNKALQWSNTLEKSVLGQVAMGGDFTSIVTAISPNYIDAVGASMASIANEGYDYDGMGIVDTNGNYLTGTTVSGKEFLQTLTLAEQGNTMAQKEVTEMQREMRDFGGEFINRNGQLWDTSMMMINSLTAATGTLVGRAELAIENIQEPETRDENIAEFKKNANEDFTELYATLGYSYEGITEFIFQTDSQASAKAWVDDHFGVSLALEIFLDPTTYMTFGLSTLFKSTTKSVKALTEVTQNTNKLTKNTANFRKFNAPGSEVRAMDLEKNVKDVEKLQKDNLAKKAKYQKRKLKEEEKLKKSKAKYAKLYELDPETMKYLHGDDIKVPPKSWYSNKGIRKRRAANKINQSQMTIKNYDLAIKRLENLELPTETFLKFSTKIIEQLKQTPGYKAEVEIKQLTDEFDKLEKQVKTLDEKLEAKHVAQRNLGTISLELENKIKKVGGLETLENVLEQLSYTDIDNLDISSDAKNEVKSLYNKLRKTNNQIEAIRPETTKIIEEMGILSTQLNKSSVRLRQLLEMVSQRSDYGDIKTYDVEVFAKLSEANVKNLMVNIGNEFFSAADFEQQYRKYVNKRYKGSKNKETREKLYKADIEYKKNFVLDNWLIDADIRYGLDGEIYSAAKQERKHGYYDPANTEKFKQGITRILKEKGYDQQKIDKAMGFIDMELTQLTPEEFVQSMNSYHKKLNTNFDKGLQPTASFLNRTIVDDVDEFADLLEKDVLLKNGFTNHQDVLQFEPEYAKRFANTAIRRFTDPTEAIKNTLHKITGRSGRQITKMKNNTAIYTALHAQLKDMGLSDKEIAMNTTWALDLLNETMHNWSLAELEKRVFDPKDATTSIISLNKDFEWWADDFKKRVNKNETLVDFYSQRGGKKPSDFVSIKTNMKESETGKFLRIDFSDFKSQRKSLQSSGEVGVYTALETEMKNSLEAFFKNYAYGEHVPFTKDDLHKIADGIGVDGNYEMIVPDLMKTVFFKDVMEKVIASSDKNAAKHTRAIMEEYNEAQRRLVSTENVNYKINEVFDEEEFEYYKVETINKYFNQTFINYKQMENKAKGEVLKTIKRKSNQTVQDVVLGTGRGVPRLFNDPDLIKQVGIDNLQSAMYNEIDKLALKIARDASELGLKGIDFQKELIEAINENDLIKKLYDEGSYDLQQDLSKVSMRSILRKMEKHITPNITDDTIWWSDQLGVGIKGTDRQQNNVLNKMMKEYDISKEAAQELLHNRFGFYRIYNQKATGREVHATSQQPDLRHNEFVGVPHIKKVRSFVKQRGDINVDNQEDLNATFDITDNEMFNAHVLTSENFQDIELLEKLKDTEFDLEQKIKKQMDTISKFEQERIEDYNRRIKEEKIADIQAKNNVNTLKNKLSTKVINEIGEKDITTIIDEFLKVDAKQYIKDNREVLRDELQDNEIFKELYNPNSKNMSVHLNSVLNKTLRFEMTDYLSKVNTKKEPLPMVKREYEEIEVEIPNVFDEIDKTGPEVVGFEFDKIKLYEELSPRRKYELFTDFFKTERLKALDELGEDGVYEAQIGDSEYSITMEERIIGSDKEPSIVVGIKGPQEKEILKIPEPIGIKNSIIDEIFGEDSWKYSNNKEREELLKGIFSQNELDESGFFVKKLPETQERLTEEQLRKVANSYTKDELYSLSETNDLGFKKSWTKKQMVDDIVKWFEVEDLTEQFAAFDNGWEYQSLSTLYKKLDELGIYDLNITPFVEKGQIGSFDSSKFVYEPSISAYSKENLEKFLDFKLQIGELDGSVWNRFVKKVPSKQEMELVDVVDYMPSQEYEQIGSRYFDKLVMQGKITPSDIQRIEKKETGEMVFVPREEKLTVEEERQLAETITNEIFDADRPEKLINRYNLPNKRVDDILRLVEKTNWENDMSTAEDDRLYDEKVEYEDEIADYKDMLGASDLSKAEKEDYQQLVKETQQKIDFIQERFDFNNLEPKEQDEIRKQAKQGVEDSIYDFIHNGGKGNTTSKTLDEQFRVFKGKNISEKQQQIEETLQKANIPFGEEVPEVKRVIEEETGEEIVMGPGLPIFEQVTKTIQVPRLETKFKDVETGEILDEAIQPEQEYKTSIDIRKLKQTPMREPKEITKKGDTQSIRNTRIKLEQNKEMLKQVGTNIEILHQKIRQEVDPNLVDSLERIDYLNFKQGQQQDYLTGLEAIEAEKKVETETIKTIETKDGPKQIKVKAPKSLQIFADSVNSEELNIIKGGMQEISNIVEGLKPLEDLVTSDKFKKATTSEKTKLERQEKINEYAAGMQQIQRIFEQDIKPYIGERAITPNLDTTFYEKQIGHIDDEIKRRELELEESYTGISNELDASFIERAMQSEDFDYTSEINDGYQILQLIEKEKITEQDMLRAMYPEEMDPTRFSDHLFINEEFARRMNEVTSKTKTIREVGVRSLTEEYKEPENKTARLKSIKKKQSSGKKLSSSDIEFMEELETFEKIQQMISNGAINDIYTLDFSAFKDDPIALEKVKQNLKRIIDAAYIDEYDRVSKFEAKMPIMKGELYQENLDGLNAINNSLREKIGNEMYKRFIDTFNTVAHDASLAGYDTMVEIMGVDKAQKSSVGQMEGEYGSSRKNKATIDRNNFFAIMNGAMERTNSNPNIRMGHVKTYEYLDQMRKETGKAQTVSGPERRPVDMMEPLSAIERTRIANEINKKVSATKIIQVPKRKKAQGTLKDVEPEMRNKVVPLEEGNYITRLIDELASAGVQDLTREDRRNIIVEVTNMSGKDYKDKKIDEIDRRLGKIYDNRRASEEIMFYNQMSFTERNAKGPLHILNQEAAEQINKRNVFGRDTGKSIKMFEDNPIEYLNRYVFMQIQDTTSESLIMSLPDYVKGFEAGGEFNYITEHKPRNRRPWSKERRNDNSMVKIRIKDIIDNDRGLLGTFTREQKLALREELQALQDRMYKHGEPIDNLSILIDRKDFNLLQNTTNAFGRANNPNLLMRGFSHATRLLKGSALWGSFKLKFALSVPLMTGFLEGQSLSKTMKELAKLTHNDEKMHEWLKKDFANSQTLKDLERLELDDAFDSIRTNIDLSDSERTMLETFVFESAARSFSSNLKHKYINVNDKRAKSMRLGDNKPKSDVIDHITQMGSNVPVLKHLTANFDSMEAGALVRAKTLFEDTALLNKKVREFGMGDVDLNDANQRMSASIRIAEDELGIGESNTLAQEGWRGGINKMVLFPGYIMRAFPKMMMNYFGTPAQLGRMGGLLILFDNFKYASGYNQYQINSMTAKERTQLNFRLSETSEDGSLQINLFSPLDVLNTFGDIKQATSVTQWLINTLNPLILAPIEMKTGKELDSYGKSLQNSGYSPLDAMKEAEGLEKIAPMMQYLFTMMTGNVGKVFTQTRNLLSGQDDFGNYYVQPGASDYAINVVNAFAKKFGLNPYERVTIDDIPILSSIFNYQEDPQGIDAARDIWYDVIKKDFEEYKATVEGTKEGQAVAEKVSKFEKRSQASYVLNQMNKAKQDTNKDMPETLVEGATQKNIEESGLSNYDVLKAKAETAQKQLERKLAYIKAHD